MFFPCFIYIFGISSSSLPLAVARSIHYGAIEYRQLDTIYIRFNTITSFIDSYPDRLANRYDRLLVSAPTWIRLLYNTKYIRNFTIQEIYAIIQTAHYHYAYTITFKYIGS